MNSKGFKAIILDEMKEVLNPFKFVKHGNTFKSSNADIIYYIELQCSKYSTSTELIFTINIGFGSVLLYQLEGKTVTSHLRGHLSKRIGSYLDSCSDKWWTVRDEKAAKQVGDEVKTIIMKDVLTDLNKIKTTDELIEYWLTNLHAGVMDYQVNRYLLLLEKAKQEKS